MITVTQQNGYWIIDDGKGLVLEHDREHMLKKLPFLNIFEKKSLARINQIKLKESVYGFLLKP
jgi:hypothetical protein